MKQKLEKDIYNSVTFGVERDILVEVNNISESAVLLSDLVAGVFVSEWEMLLRVADRLQKSDGGDMKVLRHSPLYVLCFSLLNGDTDSALYDW